MKKLRLVILLLSFWSQALSQSDTCGLRVSLLTCAPGADLYSIFGHTAIRVQDASEHSDIVFNYGTFEFGPDFYPQFIRGKLPYFLSTDSYGSFVENYRYESRSIREQELLLSCEEKRKLVQALFENLRPENRFYRYDFLFDNCTTRARDIIANNSPQPVAFTSFLPARRPSFRNLIHVYLDAGHQYWSKLGIDLLLGSPLDRSVTNTEAMFLPDNLLAGMEGATSAGKPLMAPAVKVLDLPSPQTDSGIIKPMAVFSMLLLLLLLLSFSGNRSIQKGLRLFDTVFFLLIGAAGCFFVFMWAGTDHQVSRWNYNLLWALPTHLFAAPFLHRKSPFMSWYLLATIILQSLLVIGWIFLPQQLNLAMLPVVVLILLRSWLILSNSNDAEKKHTV